MFLNVYLQNYVHILYICVVYIDQYTYIYIYSYKNVLIEVLLTVLPHRHVTIFQYEFSPRIE